MTKPSTTAALFPASLATEADTLFDADFYADGFGAVVAEPKETEVPAADHTVTRRDRHRAGYVYRADLRCTCGAEHSEHTYEDGYEARIAAWSASHPAGKVAKPAKLRGLHKIEFRGVTYTRKSDTRVYSHVVMVTEDRPGKNDIAPSKSGGVATSAVGPWRWSSTEAAAASYAAELTRKGWTVQVLPVDSVV